MVWFLTANETDIYSLILATCNLFVVIVMNSFIYILFYLDQHSEKNTEVSENLW